MLKYFIPLAAAAMLVGCETSVGIHPTASSSRQETAQLAAYAATVTYPTQTKATYSPDWHVGAMTKGGDIRLVNYTDRPISNANIWVNGTYVHNVASIPARSSTTISAADFFDKNGHVMTFDTAAMAAARFEIQTANNLYTIMGPVSDSQ